MNNSRIKYYLLVLVFVIPLHAGFSQNVTETEKRYNAVTITLEAEQRKLDSLNMLMNERALTISREKKKSKQDKERITDLMSKSMSLSNHISELQKRIIVLESRREDLKSVLRNVYSRIIDSLNTVKVSDMKNTDTELQILIYSEKKLSIVQRFPDLSFNPSLIISIDPGSIKNYEERKIFRDILIKALTEIEQKINYVDKQSAEISQVLLLQKKAEKFLEESEYNNSYSISRKKSNTELAARDGFDNSKDYVSNAANAASMLNQFRAIEKGEHKTRPVLSSNLSNLSIKDYQSMLKELKENLVIFRTILIHKSKSLE